VNKKHFLLLLPLALYFLIKPSDQPYTAEVLGASTERTESLLAKETTISTKTAFDQKEIIEEETIPFEIIYKEDKNVEYGEEEIIEEGVNGVKKTRYLITYWFDDVIDRVLAGVETIEPKDQIVSKGTKVVWRTVDTPDGEIKYWRKLRVWATKYDGNCVGCRGLTYSGTLVRKGVCAVDPKVISLGTNFYVAGYGMCRSEDIGGGIKGNKVDLGFEDASKGNWGAAWTDVYLMTSYPTD
jgi:3D (Asp-Asp-Asp) domain-containing protein